MIQHAQGSRDLAFLPHLSVMATCSSMAEPVLDFQLPDMEVLLKRVKHTFALPFQRIRILSQKLSLHLHVGFVVGADLLDSDVVFGVDERFRGRVRLGQRHHAGYVLELHVVLHLHLDAEEELCVHQEEGSQGGVFSYLSDAGVGVANLHDHRK